MILFFLLYKWVASIQSIYDWHCTYIFPFNKYLSDLEKKYIQKCINYSWHELFRIFKRDLFIRKLSFFTFSHHVKKKINSSRVAFGAVIYPEKLHFLVDKILEERNLKRLSEYTFYGLGWDFKRKHFKIYYIFEDYNKLPEKYKLAKWTENHFKQGLLSFTYKKKKTETKIYLYTKDKTFLHSKKRNHIQIDSCHPSFPKKGQTIIDFYKKANMELDTSNFVNEKEYVLYFPKIQ